MFEYKIMNFKGPNFEKLNKLNELGADGWELIQCLTNNVTGTVDWIFKRDMTKSVKI